MEKEKKEIELRELVTEHSVEIKQIKGSLDDIKLSLDAIFRQLREQNKFPVMPVITTLFGVISVIALLAGGYIGQPMFEIKSKQEWTYNKLFDLQYTLGKREHMIDANTDGLVALDTTLQREMRLLDDISNERLKALDEVLQREMRLLGDVLNEKINAINEKLIISTDSRFTASEGERLQKQLDEISKEQRRRTEKVYQ